MTRPTPFALCRLARVRGRWYFRTVSRHTTARAALNRAAFPAAMRGGCWRVRDTRSGQWVEELSGGSGAVPAPGEEVREWEG